MPLRFFALSSSLIALTACGAMPSATMSTFDIPAENGTFDGVLQNQRGGSERVQAGGFAYRVGQNGDEGFVAEAGTFLDTDVGEAPPTGVVTYNGTFEVAMVTDIETGYYGSSGMPSSASGSFSLVAAFESQTFSGSGSGLSMTGTTAGGTLDGTATYQGASGQVTGMIGPDTAIGAFHGNDDQNVFAGGFIANSQ